MSFHTNNIKHPHSIPFLFVLETVSKKALTAKPPLPSAGPPPCPAMARAWRREDPVPGWRAHPISPSKDPSGGKKPGLLHTFSALLRKLTWPSFFGNRRFPPFSGIPRGKSSPDLSGGSASWIHCPGLHPLDVGKPFFVGDPSKLSFWRPFTTTDNRHHLQKKKYMSWILKAKASPAEITDMQVMQNTIGQKKTSTTRKVTARNSMGAAKSIATPTKTGKTRQKTQPNPRPAANGSLTKISHTKEN